MYRIIASALCHDSLQPYSAIRSLLPTLSRFQLQLRMDVPLRHLEFLALVLVFFRSYPPNDLRWFEQEEESWACHKE
jgi:hypothetical protein